MVKQFNIKLTVSYDGTDFFGFQKTKAGPSVEEELEKALGSILQESVKIQAASRTDRGVHAKGQVVNFFTDKFLNLKQLHLSLNQLLPSSIAILDVEEMPISFHPTLDVISKEYHYLVYYGIKQPPLMRHMVWHHPCPAFDLLAVQKASVYLIGSQDYSVLCLNRKKDSYKNCERFIESIDISLLEDKTLCIKVVGKTFFYKMVRSLVGTLIAVGKGKIQLQEVPLLLKQKDRALSGMTAPAHGLTLIKVKY